MGHARIVFDLPKREREAELRVSRRSYRKGLGLGLATALLSCVAVCVWDGTRARENLPYEDALTIIENPEEHSPDAVRSAAFRAKTEMKRGIVDLQALRLLEGTEHAKTRTDAEVHLAWLLKHLEEN